MPSKIRTLTMRDLKDQVFKAFFPSKPRQDELFIGIELEIWPLRSTTHSPADLVPFFNDEETGLIQLLKRLEGSLDNMRFAPTADGVPRFQFENLGTLTFEPGGQLEFSSSPMPNLADAIQAVTQVIEILRCSFKAHGIWFFHGGLNPWYTVEEVGLQMKKARYLHMNNYFQAIGSHGQRMMRLSTSLQVNLDVGGPETAQRRWLAANLLAPIFTAAFANSPFVDRKTTGNHSERALIWQRLDPSRTGFQKGFLSKDYQPCPVEQYFDFALDANVMRLPDAKGEMVFDGRFISFREWWEHGSHGLFPDIEDWNEHLSTLFPEVRAKGFFEIRYLDAQSKVWCAVPGILLTYLIYNEEAREEAIRLIEPYRPTLSGMLNVAATQALQDTEIAALSKRIYQLALKHSPVGEAPALITLCERFFEQYTHQNRTPADELLRLNDGDLFTPAQYRDFEKKQVDRAGDVLEIICEYQ